MTWHKTKPLTKQNHIDETKPLAKQNHWRNKTIGETKPLA